VSIPFHRRAGHNSHGGNLLNQQMNILDTALLYHNRGLWVTLNCEPTHTPGNCTVPREVPCHSPGKAPIHARWQTERLTAEQIRHALTRCPTLNIGCRWGPESGIIDVEADSKAAERALQDLLDETGFPDLSLIPTYASRRSYHQLFQWCEGLPKSVIKLNGIEFRCGGSGKGAQSIMPPSIHPSGTPYRWLEFLSLNEVEPPPLPPRLVEMIRAEQVPADSLVRMAVERFYR
jgi:Bifunctional DNA primase/polymerase, N-terminal